jgi:HPt (histidine-containing phosphotransfer) domain-containing protein
MRPAVDLERLAEFSDGTEQGMRTIGRIFLEDISETLDALRDAVARGNPADVRQIAHRAGGSSGACGAPRLAALLQDLENIARSGSIEGSGPLVAAIDAELERVRLFLQTMLVPRGETG